MRRPGRMFAALALVVASTVCPNVASADEKKIADVKELAGTWQGWVTNQNGDQTRALMTIKEDGSYQSSATDDGGTLTVGTYYLERGRLRYRSSRTQGSVTVSDEKGKSVLTVSPEGSYSFATGRAVFERVK